VLSGAKPFAAAREVDLLGRIGPEVPLAPDGSISLSLAPWEIRTIRVRPARPN